MDFFIPVDSFRIFLFSLIAVPCAMYDYHTHTVPRIALLFLLTLMICTPIRENISLNSLVHSTFNALAGILVFFITRIVSNNKLGLADVWFSGAIGALGGFYFFILTTCISIILILPMCIIQYKKNQNDPIPFLPFLLTSTFFSYIFFIFLGKI